MLRHVVPIIVLAALTQIGCDNRLSERNPEPQIKEGQHSMSDKITREIHLSGFDPEGEPVIRTMTDGTLYVVFNFMPPSWVDESEYADLGPFAEFDKEMERAIGVPVFWEDREFFLVRNPKSDTVDQITRFVEGYRKKVGGKHP